MLIPHLEQIDSDALEVMRVFLALLHHLPLDVDEPVRGLGYQFLVLTHDLSLDVGEPVRGLLYLPAEEGNRQEHEIRRRIIVREWVPAQQRLHCLQGEIWACEKEADPVRISLVSLEIFVSHGKTEEGVVVVVWGLCDETLCKSLAPVLRKRFL